MENNEYLAMFISCILVGFLAGFLFDLCRALRVGLKLKRIVPFLDIVFWISVLILTYAILFTSGSGQLRGFCILAILGGVVLYALCFSKILGGWMVISVRTAGRLAGQILSPVGGFFGLIGAKIGGIVQIIQKNRKIFGKKTLENSEKNSII